MLDTHVWLDLLAFRDPRVMPLADALASGAAVALMDDRMHAELDRVLAYPQLALDGPTRMRIAEAAAQFSRRQPSPPAVTPRCRDPDDQMFVELALAARVDALLSRDAALLRMAPRLRREGVDVLTP